MQKKLFFGWSLLNILMAAFGAFLFALGVNLFTVPAGLYNGGFLGIGQLIRTFLTDVLGMNFGQTDVAGIIYYICNVPLFILAFRKIGKPFAYRTIICMTMFTLFLTLIPSPREAVIEEPLTASLIGGIIAGAGTGTILYAGGSSGGTDILGIHFSKRYKNFSVGRMAMIVNLFVYAICAFLFDFSIVIYSVIYVTFSSFVVDKVYQQNICTQIFILTKEDPRPINQYITENIVRGTTYWEAIGGYTGEKTNIIFAVTSKYELQELQRFLRKYDEHAFVVKQDGIAIEGRFEKKL